MKKFFILLTALLLLLAPARTAFTPVSASAEETKAKVLFSDDFESGKVDAGKWEAQTGSPYIVSVDPEDPANKVLACPLDKAENTSSKLTTRQSFTNFTLVMRVYVLKDFTGFFGVNARVTGNQSFVVTFNHTWKGEFGYSGNSDNYDDNLVISDKEWHEVRLIADGTRYEIYVDGGLRQSAEDSHLTGGPLSIVYWSKSFYIDDFTVYEGRVEEVIGSGGNTTYYVDADAAPGGDGLTPETAWQGIAQVNRQRAFFPGDKILFKRGCTFAGLIMAPRGSGEDGNPILVGSYGEGALPILDACMPISEKNNFSTIVLRNQNFWTFENLQIQNSNPGNPGVPEDAQMKADGNGSLPIRGGLRVFAKYINGQNMYKVRGIEIRNCLFAYVDGSGGDEGNSYRQETGKLVSCGGGCIAGTASSSDDGQYNAWIDGMKIENCEFYNYAGTAISTGFSGNVYNENIVVRNNLFHCDEDYTASNHAVYICHSNSPLVEYNVYKNLTCGMAFQVCKNGTMRYNVAMNLDGYQHGASKLTGRNCYWDGCAFDVDSDCTGTFDFYGNFTYNCFSGTFSSFNFNKTKCTINIHDNISYNDREVLFHNATKLGYKINLKNNTFVRDDKTGSAIIDVLNMEGDNLRKLETPVLNVSNNLFYYPDQRVRLLMRATAFENNVYLGEFKGDVDETTAHQAALKLNIPKPEEFANMSYCGNLPGTGNFCDSGFFLMLSGSEGFNAGAPTAGVDILAFQSGREFWGQTVNTTLYGADTPESSEPAESEVPPTQEQPDKCIPAVVIVSGAVLTVFAAAVILLVIRKKKAAKRL